MQTSTDPDTFANDTTLSSKATDSSEKDGSQVVHGVTLSGSDTPQQLMVASRLLKLAQRLPSAKPYTTAEQDTIMLSELARRTHGNLFESKPLVLMASSNFITIDRQKVTVTHRSLFKVRQTVSIQVMDIINVQANIGVLYGSLTITSKHFLNNIQSADHLRRSDVIRARRLLQGLIIACQAKIDITKIETTKLLEMLDDLGKENRSP